jgi:hypothetical protein
MGCECFPKRIGSCFFEARADCKLERGERTGESPIQIKLITGWTMAVGLRKDITLKTTHQFLSATRPGAFLVFGFTGASACASIDEAVVEFGHPPRERLSSSSAAAASAVIFEFFDIRSTLGTLRDNNCVASTSLANLRYN